MLGSDKGAHGGIPNGITLSPDEKYLYVTSGGRRTKRYDILPDDTVANGRLFVEHGSDGMRVDQKGNLGRLHLPQPVGEPRARVTFVQSYLFLAPGGIMLAMPIKKKGRRKVPLIVAAVVRPVSTRLSRMEDLLIEMRAEQDVKLKKINRLQQQFDELTETLKRRLI